MSALKRSMLKKRHLKLFHNSSFIFLSLFHIIRFKYKLFIYIQPVITDYLCHNSPHGDMKLKHNLKNNEKSWRLNVDCNVISQLIVNWTSQDRSAIAMTAISSATNRDFSRSKIKFWRLILFSFVVSLLFVAIDVGRQRRRHSVLRFLGLCFFSLFHFWNEKNNWLGCQWTLYSTVECILNINVVPPRGNRLQN